MIQGDLIAKHWQANQGWDLNKDGKIQYVLLKGEPGHPDAEARTTYVVKELNDKGIQTEQLALDTAMWDTAQAKDKMDARYLARTLTRLKWLSRITMRWRWAR